MGSSPHANGGLLRASCACHRSRPYAVAVEHPGQSEHENTYPLGELLRDTIVRNPDGMRVFGPMKPPPIAYRRFMR